MDGRGTSPVPGARLGLRGSCRGDELLAASSEKFWLYRCWNHRGIFECARGHFCRPS